MLQSVGLCRDSYHELSEVVWCRMGCRFSVVKLFGGLCAFVVVVMMVVKWHCAGCCCVAVSWSWALGGGGVKLGRQAVWRPRCNRCCVVKRLMALCSLLVFVIACSWALDVEFELGRQAA